METSETKAHIPIFVGSTFEDLKEYRKAVSRALVQLGTIVRGMEYFGCQPDSPVQECLREVRMCKIYIGIFGMRYGSIPDGYEKSMTHLEYEEAQKAKLPSLIYLIDEEKQRVLPKYVDIGEAGQRLQKLKVELKKRHKLECFTGPDNLAAKLYHDVPRLLKRMSTETEELPHLLSDSESARLDLWATFGLAKSGDSQARGRLLELCADRDDRRHAAAATMLADLGDDGVNALVEQIKQAKAKLNCKREQSLVLALSCVLRRNEEVAPRSWGQPWLRNISKDVRRKVKTTYRSQNLQAARKDILATFLWYGNLTGFAAGMGSLPCSVLGANVLWRTSVSPAGFSKFLTFFTASMIAGLVLWGGLLPIAHLFGRQFERPKRFLMIVLAGMVSLSLSTLGIWAFAQSQGRGALVELLGPENTVVLLSSYLSTLSVLVSIGLIACILAKELPVVTQRLPSGLFSFLTIPMVVTALGALTIPLFSNTELTLRELRGEMMIVSAGALGFGFADYIRDLRNVKRKANIQT